MIDQRAETRSKPVLFGAEPQLFIADMAVSVAFYTRKLGFAVAFTYGEPPFYGQVFRGGAKLNLRCVGAPVIDQRARGGKDLLSASITLDDAEALFLEFQAADVTFHRTLKREAWGAWRFIVSDPDRNLILFAGRDT